MTVPAGDEVGLLQMRIVQHSQDCLECQPEIPTVEADLAVDRADTRVQRQLFGRQEMEQSNLGRVQTQSVCGEIEQTLSREGCCGLTGASIRRGGALVSYHRYGVDLE